MLAQSALCNLNLQQNIDEKISVLWWSFFFTFYTRHIQGCWNEIKCTERIAVKIPVRQWKQVKQFIFSWKDNWRGIFNGWKLCEGERGGFSKGWSTLGEKWNTVDNWMKLEEIFKIEERLGKFKWIKKNSKNIF